MTIVHKVGQWNAARALLNGMGGRYNRAVTRAIKLEAQLFRSMVLRAFNTRGRSNGKAWPKLQPATIRRKGSTKPLIDRGDLRNSVAVIDRGGAIFVGVPSNTRSARGPIVSIAAVHEYGKTIIQKRGSKIVVIKIPRRSFIADTAGFHFKAKAVRERVAARVQLALGKGMGNIKAPAKASQLADIGKAQEKASRPPRARRMKARRL